jgi:two-component system response regulator PilR (NtrC family)
MKRLLLVGGNALFREALALLLARETGLDSVQAGSVAEARRVLAGPHGAVDLAIVDIDLSDGDAIVLIEELHEANPDVAVLALVAGRNLERCARVLRAGADQVVSLGAPIDELVGGIRTRVAIERQRCFGTQ